MLADQIVHTTGVNWDSVGVISGIIAAWFTILSTTLVGYLNRRERRQTEQNEAIKNEIAAAVNHLSDTLLLKLETKETVAGISQRLARVEGALGVPNNAH